MDTRELQAVPDEPHQAHHRRSFRPHLSMPVAVALLASVTIPAGLLLGHEAAAWFGGPPARADVSATPEVPPYGSTPSGGAPRPAVPVNPHRLRSDAPASTSRTAAPRRHERRETPSPRTHTPAPSPSPPQSPLLPWPSESPSGSAEPTALSCPPSALFSLPWLRDAATHLTITTTGGTL